MIRLLPLPLLLLCALVLIGCKPQPGAAVDRVPPNPGAPALYGPPKGTVSVPTQPTPSPARETNWSSSPFHVVHTDLSPAILVHSSTRYLGLFSDLASSGLGAPSHVAWSTREGPRTFKKGQTQDSTGMEENWLLVWFAGATNWTNWDAPWAVFLQHKPNWTRLDDDGLHLEFPATAGDVVIMPLYGYFKLPPFGHDYLVEHGIKSRKLYSWEWEKGIARDPLARLRFWAGALREFPIHCEETFSVDRARDEVTIRSRFQWHSIHDDWNTKHFKLAPISPPLGLVAKDKNFPVRFSKPFFDMELPTPLGPYLAIHDVDSYDATFSVLHYVNEMEAIPVPGTNASPIVASAQAKLHAFAEEIPVESVVRGLGYLDEQTRSNSIARLKARFHASGQDDGAGLGGNFLDSVWAYAHFSGDWAIVRGSWPGLKQWKQLMATLSVGRWAGFGIRPGLSGPDDAAEYLAYARLAYQAGDMEAYANGCESFARELVRLTVELRGGSYFQNQQPLHSMQWIGDAFVNSLRENLTGWELQDSPTGNSRRLLSARWKSVRSPDVARFCRDYLREELWRELGQPPLSVETNAGQFQLRSMLLNEAPAGSVTTPEFLQGNDADLWASYLAIVRSSRAPRFERLIPPGEPSPFFAAATLELRNAHPGLLTHVEGMGERAWPRLQWPAWKSPSGAPWTFGRIQPVRDGQPPSMKQTPLNRNTEVLTYTLP